jgi:hypothetical protein
MGFDMASKPQEKAWMYVGRFIGSIANVEAAVDNILDIMYNLDAGTSLLFRGNLTLRKKLDILERGFRDLAIDPGGTLSRIHDYHDIRNVVVHSWFEPVASDARWMEDGTKVHYEAGIEFSYITKSGALQFPPKMKALKQKKSGQRERVAPPDDLQPDETTITYSEFDEYDAELTACMKKLVELEASVTPINEGSGFVRDMAKLIASSDNVVPYRKPAPKK